MRDDSKALDTFREEDMYEHYSVGVDRAWDDNMERDGKPEDSADEDSTNDNNGRNKGSGELREDDGMRSEAAKEEDVVPVPGSTETAEAAEVALVNSSLAPPDVSTLPHRSRSLAPPTMTTPSLRYQKGTTSKDGVWTQQVHWQRWPVVICAVRDVEAGRR